MTVTGGTRIFIFQDFETKEPPIFTHFSARSNHLWKAVAQSAAVAVLITILKTALVQRDDRQGLLRSPEQEKVGQREKIQVM
jgi:hypothetical protein